MQKLNLRRLWFGDPPSVPRLPFFRLRRAVRGAHGMDIQWTLGPKVSWAEGSARLQETFPREVRPGREARWYLRIAETHAPGRIIPGNGPFFVPEWAWTGVADGEEICRLLKKAGFRRMLVPRILLPRGSEYLAVAVEMSAGYSWNALPTLPRLYVYPDDPAGARRPLRSFTVDLDRRGTVVISAPQATVC